MWRYVEVRLVKGGRGITGDHHDVEIQICNTALPPADAAATGDNPAISQLD
ncbi:hypothetical protein ACFV23_16160 [Streptomyces sp. NPDC059627]